MVPPPITPAPPRFLPSASTEKPKPQVGRPQFAQQQPTPPPNTSSQRQFATTPRFSFTASSKKSSGAKSSAHVRPLASSSPFPPKHVSHGLPKQFHEDIEEPSSGEGGVEDVQRPSDFDIPDELDDLRVDEEPSKLPTAKPSKRRRLHPPSIRNEEQIIISSSPVPGDSPPVTPPLLPASSLSPPTTPPPLHHQPYSTNSSGHPRFRLTLPSHSSPPSISTKPSFILPKAPESPPTSVPSALLSPHRRGQKYIAGGLASVARDWIVETGRSVYRSRSDGITGEEQGRVVKVRVDEVAPAEKVGGGVTLVKEMAGSGQGQTGRNWLLIGNPKTRYGRDLEEADIRRGTILGVGNPTWDIDVPGLNTWHVGLEWEIFRETN